ncbi:MAG: hypothetical protein LBS27_04055 [Bifidobacteriaceae bacterium]|jgi:ABC-type multidrug transport system permease subunit|nr:hypothetical protein [Bifidobacteriaceae bacterium]
MRYMVEAIGGSLTGVAPSSAIGLGAIVLAGVAALFFGGATKIVKWL